MAFNDDATLIATYGTLFYAPVGTPLPKDGAKAFKLNADTVKVDTTASDAPNANQVWTNLGHTSADNKISFSFDGGDATTHNSWARKNCVPPTPIRRAPSPRSRCSWMATL